MEDDPKEILSPLLSKPQIQRQIGLLHKVIKEAQKRVDYTIANDGDIIKAIQCVERFLRKKRRVCYGGQAINALCPAPPGAPRDAFPPTTRRLYHPPSMPEFQSLKFQLEQQWVPAMQKLLEIDDAGLPVLWDCDFLLGPRNGAGQDTYVLCEINVSSVSPFPDSALVPIAEAALARTKAIKRR